jgi:hypothetical protein
MLTCMTSYATECLIITDSSKSLSVSNFLLFHVLIYVLLPLIYIVLKVTNYIKPVSHDNKSHILLHNGSHSSTSKYKIPSFWLILNLTKCCCHKLRHILNLYICITVRTEDNIQSIPSSVLVISYN